MTSSMIVPVLPPFHARNIRTHHEPSWPPRHPLGPAVAVFCWLLKAPSTSASNDGASLRYRHGNSYTPSSPAPSSLPLTRQYRGSEFHEDGHGRAILGFAKIRKPGIAR